MPDSPPAASRKGGGAPGKGLSPVFAISYQFLSTCHPSPGCITMLSADSVLGSGLAVPLSSVITSLHSDANCHQPEEEEEKSGAGGAVQLELNVYL